MTEALFWKSLSRKRVRCDVCYRRCELEPGDVGWCRVRENNDGVLEIPHFGQLAALMPRRLTHWSFRHGDRSLWIGGMSCTSGCVFCTSQEIALHPERLPIIQDDRLRRMLERGAQWSYERGYVDPYDVLDRMRRDGVDIAYFGINEPLLDVEWFLETARLLKEAGYVIHLDTNGFSTPQVIAAAAPLVDSVYVGVKGSADPDFYAKRQRAAGAVPTVLDSLTRWKAAGVQVGVYDIPQPPHWADDATAEDHMRRFYTFVAERLGVLTPLQLLPMLDPTGHQGELLLPRDAGAKEHERSMERYLRAVQIARECGLLYAYPYPIDTVCCHACNGVLLRSGRGFFSIAELHVTDDSRCVHCGADVPIVPPRGVKQ